ncbi:MAG: 23S rRNA pseudouridine(955/2504/2580) synthase, partial [Pseudomonadales bacterium]|nr:23S rRNA pseudouridine(955/2504/2580) synthase [Pseudomonadales bacterium]
MSTGVRVVEVDPDSTGQRVDNFLMKHLKGVPKSRIYRIVRKGEVRVNGGRVKADSRLSAGDQVRIPPVREAEPTEVRVSDPVLQQLYL